MIDTTFATDNPLCFRNTLLKRILKIIMTTDDKIREEKLENDINREAIKVYALSSGKTDKYEYYVLIKYYLLIRVEW